MKNNDASKENVYQRLIKGQDWTFRDDGYFSPRDDEQYSFTSSSILEEHEQGFKFSCRKFKDHTTSSPTGSSAGASPNLTPFSSKRNEAPKKTLNIHNKLEEMLQRRLHGVPVANKARITQTEISASSNTSLQSLRSKEGIGRSVCSADFYSGHTEHGLSNGYPGNLPQQTYFDTAEHLQYGADKGTKSPYNPKLAINHQYSESAKLKKHRLLQELSSSFRTPEVDERHCTYEDLTTAFQESYDASEECWNKFKSDTLRDTHVDSDTRPINRANVVSMLKKHLGGEPTVVEARNNNSAKDLTNLLKTELPAKRKSVFEVFKFNSEDIRRELGDNVEYFDEDEEIIRALNNGPQSTSVHRGTGNGVHLASLCHTDHMVPHQAIGINNVYQQNRFSNPPERTVENSECNMTSLQEKSPLTAPQFQNFAASPINSLYLGILAEQKQERAKQTKFLHEHPMKRTEDLSTRKRAEEMVKTVVASMSNRSPTVLTTREESTEYYDPKNNDESVIKPSQFKRHSLGTMISRPIHIHQNILGTDPPAYVPQSSARQSWQSIDRLRVQDASNVAISEQVQNHQTFSELMGLCPAALPTRISNNAADANLLNHLKHEGVVHSPINDKACDNAKEKWHSSWRNRRLRKDKDYVGDAESVSILKSDSRSNGSSRSTTPRSMSPMLTLLKSLSSKFSPSLGRSAHKKKPSLMERIEDGGLFLPDSEEEVQRRIRMNGIVRVSDESKICGHPDRELDDVALGEFVSARDWLDKQREGFDFRCVRPEIQNGGDASKNKAVAMGMPHIKQTVVPGIATPISAKSKLSVKRESIGKVMVPAVFGGADTLAIRREVSNNEAKRAGKGVNTNHVSHHKNYPFMQQSRSLINIGREEATKDTQQNTVL